MNILKRLLEWLGEIIARELTKPLNEIKETQRQQGEAIDEMKRKIDAFDADGKITKECDLALLDDRIRQVAGECREKGFTTAAERRTLTRMHDAYKARGGNHGEELEYELFIRLPTQEEYERSHNDED